MYQISQCKDNKNVAHAQHFFLQMPFVRNILYSLKHEIALSNNLKTNTYNKTPYRFFPLRMIYVFFHPRVFLSYLHQTHQPF